MYSKRKFAAITLLACLITAIHFWLLWSDFYERKTIRSRQAILSSPRPTIAALWATSTAGKKTQERPQSKLATIDFNSSELDHQGAIKNTRQNPFSFKPSPNQQDPENQFHLYQKLQEIALKNEQIVRSASAQSALKDLRQILFDSEKSSGIGKKCCEVTTNAQAAHCTSPELTSRYQKIFDSLHYRLNELVREGIKEFCE